VGNRDLSCLSRYDGLQYVRVTGLGAWCLDVRDSYEPEPVARELLFKVLPNLDVVATQRSPAAADLLFLERFAERRADLVWRLDRTRILAALEQGVSISELREFLAAKSSEPLPQTADVFLGEIDARAAALKDAGLVRRIECADAPTAHLIVHDRRLRNFCQLASERYVLFGIDDEAAVRRGLRELGYVLPGSRS
jgi:DNA-binding transcriptional MerR regulator